MKEICFFAIDSGSRVWEVVIYYDPNGFPFGEVGKSEWLVRRVGEEVIMVGGGVVRGVEGVVYCGEKTKIPGIELRRRGGGQLQQVTVRYRLD